MKIRLPALLSVAVVLLLAGCGERGDKAIAYGKDLGQEWAGAPGQMRISGQNFFTRDVVICADAPGVHYELTIGPIRERYMIVPEAKYEITAFTKARDTGVVKLYVDKDDRNGAKGLWVKIRP